MPVIETKPVIPFGNYKAVFVRAEKRDPPENHEDYGEGLQWTFRISEGEYAGAKVCRTTALPATAGNATGKMMCALMNMTYDKASPRNTDEWKDKTYSINVGPGQDESRRVEFIIPDAEPSKRK